MIEVLLALAIMATLAITGYRALSGMLEGETHIAAERERWREMDLFFARFEQDLRNALPRTYRIGSADQPALYLADGALAFVRGSPGEIPQRLGYRWQDGHIELLYWPQLDAPAGAAPVAYPVATAVAGWEVTMLDNAGRWVGRWGTAGAFLADPLPRGARIVLTLADGSRLERLFALQ
ncbi:MAG: type II secretion system minor pseudopilin GspJ [Betaproteobacteria bacterium]